MKSQDISCFAIGQIRRDREGMGVCNPNDTDRRGVLASKRKNGREGMWGFCNMIKFVKNEEPVKGASIRVECVKRSHTISAPVKRVSCPGGACPSA